jgi:hypothetical protein
VRICGPGTVLPVRSPCAKRPCVSIRMGAADGSMRQKARGLGPGRGDDAAGDAVAGVAAGVGLHIVQLLVDDDGGTSIGEDVVRGRGVEGEVVDLEGGLAGVAFTDRDVLGKIAGVVAHGILKAVLLVLGIEVRTGGLEVGRIAEGFGVDVDAMLANGEVFEVELDGEFALSLREGSGAGVLAGGGLDGDDQGGIFGLGERRGGEEVKGKDGESCAHS